MALNWLKLHLKTLLAWVFSTNWLELSWNRTHSFSFKSLHPQTSFSCFGSWLLLRGLCIQNVYVCLFEKVCAISSWVCIYMYVRERQRERHRDICGCPLEETRRPAWFFIRFSGLWCCSCCLLLYQLLNPLIQPGIGSGRLRLLWLDLQRKWSETFDAPSAIFPVLSYRRPFRWRASWQRLQCLAWGHLCQLLFGSV